eukprot:TRINITY_DN34336_c0_g1_i1.p1 TRINITY_DN34336_c0_g1~~TRINITY_DN34336_c0_g1_i1.p1  ORF type:complete len:371 (+),score=63.39 TRINITY_DN34336_c0_g1_i1:167-1279(+)
MKCSNLLLGKTSRSLKLSYKLLGAPMDSDAKQLKASFRLMARKYHPDLNGGDDKKMKELNKAYSVVLKHIEEVAVRGSIERDDEDRSKKAAELKLVHRLSKWMKQREEVDKEYGVEENGPRSPRVSDPTVTEFKNFTSYDSAPQQAFNKILGSEEDQLRWAENFAAKRKESLERKNQSKKGVDPELVGKILPTRTQQYKDFLNSVGPRDRAWYEKIPAVRPDIAIPNLSNVNPFLAEGGRENPFIRKVQKREREKFLDTDGIHLLRKLSYKEMTERKARLVRRDRNRRKAINNDYVHEDTLKHLPAAVNRVFQLPGERDINELSAWGTRPHSALRKSSSLASFNTTVNGEIKHVVIPKEEYIRKGYSIGS